jgi:hypothetical protein
MKDLEEVAKAFCGMIEWIEEGFPPECDSRKGYEACFKQILSALQEVRRESLEEAAKIAGIASETVEVYTSIENSKHFVSCQCGLGIAKSIRSMSQAESGK